MTTGDIVNGISEYLESSGTADYITLIEGLGITGYIAGLIVGVLVAFIIVGLPLVIAVEVMYINFPVLQSGYEDLYGRLKGKKQKALGLLVRDAQLAVKESHTVQYGTNVNWIYLKIKCKAIFICVFVVALVLGPGQFLIKFAFNLVKGIISAIF